MAQVKLNNAFFQRIKSDYSDWRWAFFRELIQNSYDARANAIRFQIAEYESEGVKETHVICEDDGCGMNRDILENVLLCMGGSQKLDDSIGGYGVAKNLIFFAQKQYRVATNNLRVVGSGAEYTITEHSNQVKGTRISVVLTNNESANFEDLLRDFASYVDFKGKTQVINGALKTTREVSIVLNDKVLPQLAREYDYQMQTELGQLEFSDTDNRYSELVVCVAGLPMFRQRFYHNKTGFQGRLSLTGKSLDMLTANRDGLKSSESYKLSSLLEQLSTERTQLKVGPTIAVTVNRTDFPGRTVVHTAPEQTVNIFAEEQAKFMAEQTALINAIHEQVDISQYPENWVFRLQSVTSRRSRHSGDKTTLRQIVSMLNKRQTIKLAHSWSQIVNTMTVNTLTDQSLFAGFIFAPDCEAMHIPSDPHQILLNPMLVEDDCTTEDLLDVVYHECAHIRCSSHDETFTAHESVIRRKWRRLYPKWKPLKWTREQEDITCV